jgi:hypothetical protein
MLAIVYKQGGETARDVMVAQARLTNRVAVSFLKADREVGLLRYWGVIGYLREKNIGDSWPPVARRLLYGGSPPVLPNSAPQNNKKETNQKKVGRVAFMITSTQRAELSDRLGYEPDHIKMLKPIEASLILEHGLSPSENEKLKGLVKEHNDELVRQHQEAKLEAERVESISFSSTVAQTPLTAQMSEEKEDPLLLGSKRFESEPAPDPARSFLDHDSEPSTSSSDGTEWYEVIENRVSDGSETPVALYRNEDEAQLCLELKEEFAKRHAREKEGNQNVATTYVIRKTIK